MWQSYQNKTAQLIEWELLFNCFPILFNSKRSFRRFKFEENPSSFLLFQEERTAIQTTAFQTVFVVAPIKDMQPATGAVGKNMIALCSDTQEPVCRMTSRHKDRQTFMEITTLG